MSRKITNKLYDMMDEGILSYEQVVIACLKYMSEDEVSDMAYCNEFIFNEDEDS